MRAGPRFLVPMALWWNSVTRAPRAVRLEIRLGFSVDATIQPTRVSQVHPNVRLFGCRQLPCGAGVAPVTSCRSAAGWIQAGPLLGPDCIKLIW
jgi:hypothetical protein